jgi:hypothetical protein
MREINSEPWVQGMKAKTLRYALTTDLGSAGTVPGPITGFVDTFVLDKLLPSWKPNHFADKKLTPFMRSPDLGTTIQRYGERSKCSMP